MEKLNQESVIENINQKLTLQDVILNPEVAMNGYVLTDKVQIHNHHRKNRENVHSKNFLGEGNSAFVYKEADVNKNTCIKILWSELIVVPSEQISVETLATFGQEIEELYKRAQSIKEKRQVSKKLGVGDKINQIGDVSPMRECAFQEYLRQALEEEGINCTIPKVQLIFNHEEEEEMDDYGYYLKERYTSIHMAEVEGLSIQDIILGYPKTAEYVGTIDFAAFKSDLLEAIKVMHSRGVVHQDLTIRNIMFDKKNNRPAIIDFGKTSTESISQVFTKEDEQKHVDQVLKLLESFLKNPDVAKDNLKDIYRKYAVKAGVMG